MLHFVLGTATLSAGLILVGLGTNFGRVYDLNAGVIAGSLVVLLGVARLKYAWLKKTGRLD